jgi:methionine sulfoxide reductase heme-binding subunit
MFDQTLWFAARGSGIVSLLMLTASVCFGLLTVGRFWHEAWPRFFNLELHRRISLLAIVFNAGHVLAAVLDPFAKLGWTSAFIPLVSTYRPIPVALGVVSMYLFVALIITGLLRSRMPQGLWRAIHWTSYLMWPMAVAHSFLSGSDAGSLWMLAIGAICLGAAGASLIYRIAIWDQNRGRLEDAVLTSSWDDATRRGRTR